MLDIGKRGDGYLGRQPTIRPTSVGLRQGYRHSRQVIPFRKREVKLAMMTATKLPYLGANVFIRVRFITFLSL